MPAPSTILQQFVPPRVDRNNEVIECRYERAKNNTGFNKFVRILGNWNDFLKESLSIEERCVTFESPKHY